jgi:AAA family ATP:ADP antiporter
MAACWWRTFFPALSLFILTATFVLTKTGRDALYFSVSAGMRDLPMAYLGIAILSVPAAKGTLRLIRWLGPRHARVASLAILATLQLLFFAIARPGGGWEMTLTFILIPSLYGVVLSLAWLLGADLLDLTPRHVLARLYSTMGASSLLGGLAGAALARLLAHSIEPRAYFLVGIAGLLLTAAVNIAAHRIFPVMMMRRNDLPLPSTDGGELPDAHRLRALLRDRYVVLLAAIALSGALAGVLIEFQFYSAAAGRGGAAAVTFADFYLWVNGAALLLQLLVTTPLQRRIGVNGSLFVLPVTLVGAVALAIGTGSGLARAGLRIAEGGLKSSVHRSNWEQIYLPVDRESRAPVKLLVDGMSARAGESIAALLLMIGAAWIFPVLLATTLLWLVLTILLRRNLGAEDLSELRPDLPIPDGCITVATFGEGVQRELESKAEPTAAYISRAAGGVT